VATAHDFTFPGLNGAAPINLKDYAGKVVLLVNVASACGFTPQYRALQQLSEARSTRGLVVVGAPSNDFGRQESGSEEEIAAFCDRTYGVTFPMTGKIEIVGAGRHPFYRWVGEELGEDALPKWNFHKYIIGKDGALVGTFAPATAPLGPELVSSIADALAK
jgi:glutathione peroxidase